MESSMYLAGLHGDTMVYSNWPETMANKEIETDTTTMTPLDIANKMVTMSSNDGILPLNQSAITLPLNEREGTVISMNNLYPALVQCFGIIICGYLAGRFKIISKAETKGLSTFVGTFALPSLIFLSLIELKWSAVNWRFLLAMLTSKAIVFGIVLIIALLATRPLNYARAGLFAIFCTQSNDFAIGYPIVVALYKDIHPDYASYLYLMAPISLAILNPIGLILMEINKIGKNKRDVVRNPPHCIATCPVQSSRNRLLGFNEKTLLVLNILRSLFFNPILLMTILGTVGAFIFTQGLPEVITIVLRVLGESFSATSLFLLGLKIVGQDNERPKRSQYLLPGILILVKVLVLPLVSRQTVNIMQSGQNFSDTMELSTFAFLYGTFPAAPGAFVIATHYNINVNLIAKSLVLCTFISAPLMFISAKMISLTNLNPNDFLHEMDIFSFDISTAGVAACIWLIILWTTTRRHCNLPHRITFCLVITQLLCCLGVILWSKLEHDLKWVVLIQFFLFNVGTYGARIWTTFLAISILFMHKRGLVFVQKLWPYMIFIAWGLPIFISTLLVILDVNVMSMEKHNPSFQYGLAQSSISVFILVVCFVVTVGCLVMHQRYTKRQEKYLTFSRQLSNPESVSSDVSTTVSTINLLPDGTNLNDRNHRRYSCNSSSDDDVDYSIENNINNTVYKVEINNENLPNTTSKSLTANQPKISSSSSSTSPTTVVVDIEDLINTAKSKDEVTKDKEIPIKMCCNAEASGCNSIGIYNEEVPNQEQQTHSNENVANNRKRSLIVNDLEPIEHTDNDHDEYQIKKHIVLLVILLCSMFVGLAVSVWTLILDGMSGIYLELSFLDAFLNFGQSLMVLAVFITDFGDLFRPIIRNWRKLWYGADIVNLPHWFQLSNETKHICEQFCHHHLEKCKRDIAKDRRWRLKIYRKVFYGTEFVNWLIEVGLSKDRLEAIHYAKHLLNGRVVRHINNVYHFEDKQLLYTFCARL